jgi:hypothetical protein
MILILSHQHYEQGTDPVVEWLLAGGADFRKLSSADLASPACHWNIDVEHGDVELDGRSLRDEVSVVWYRRFQDAAPLLPELAGPHAPQLRAEVRRETATLAQYLFQVLRHKVWLPEQQARTQANNKLHLLPLAHQCGLRVPASKVTNTRAVATQFYLAHGGAVVSKPLDFCGYYVQDDAAYTAYTVRFDAEKLKALPARFFPLLLQEAIRPRYELRVFYLDGACYATAILGNYEAAPAGFADVKLLFGSQQTHMVPYDLPESLRLRLVAFMQLAGLNTGSIDLIRADNGDYVFLEVNPIGQYLEPSNRCQFHLEEKIARWLMRHDQLHAHA